MLNYDIIATGALILANQEISGVNNDAYSVIENSNMSGFLSLVHQLSIITRILNHYENHQLILYCQSISKIEALTNKQKGTHDNILKLSP